MGRRREFDEAEVLERLMQVFWRYGYDGSSMARIEQGTGLKKQSLYRLYDDKRGMYLASLQHYDRVEMNQAFDILAQPGPARQRLTALFDAVIEQAVDTGDRRGCLLCNASVDQAPHDRATALLVGAMMQNFARAFARCIARDASSCTAEEIQAQAWAMLSAYFGIRVMIKAGMSRDSLLASKEALMNPRCPL